MKMFKKRDTKPKKSWALGLTDYGSKEEVTLCAADAESGEYIAAILYFHKNGSVYRQSFCREDLERAGYDPDEHGNDWDSDGNIVIDEKTY